MQVNGSGSQFHTPDNYCCCVFTKLFSWILSDRQRKLENVEWKSATWAIQNGFLHSPFPISRSGIFLNENNKEMKVYKDNVNENANGAFTINSRVYSHIFGGKLPPKLRNSPPPTNCTSALCVVPLRSRTLFSSINRFCTRLRQRLTSDHLHQLLLISLEGPDVLSTAQLQKVVRIWHMQKKRDGSNFRQNIQRNSQLLGNYYQDFHVSK